MSAGEAYYATLMHELTHWTGLRAVATGTRETVRQRGLRDGGAGRRLGAAFLCTDLGVTPEPREDHAHTNRQLAEGDEGPTRRPSLTAASRAQAAVDYLTAKQQAGHNGLLSLRITEFSLVFSFLNIISLLTGDLYETVWLSLLELSIGLTILSINGGRRAHGRGVVVRAAAVCGSNTRVVEAREALEEYFECERKAPLPRQPQHSIGQCRFGEENCGAVALPGFADAGAMRIGALPVRTLGLRDSANERRVRKPHPVLR